MVWPAERDFEEVCKKRVELDRELISRKKDTIHAKSELSFGVVALKDWKKKYLPGDGLSRQLLETHRELAHSLGSNC